MAEPKMASHTKIRLIVFLGSLLIISCISIPVAFSFEEIVFPTNVSKLEYQNIFELELSTLFSYSFSFEEIFEYDIIDLNKNENTFTVIFTSESKLRDYSGIFPVGCDLSYKNGTSKRVPFTKNRSVIISVTRIIDIYDGKVLEVINRNDIPENSTFIYKILDDDDNEELSFILDTGVSELGYIPFAWKGAYEDIDSDTFTRSTPAGDFSCLKITEKSESEVWSTTYDTYYDEYSGICIEIRSIGELKDLYADYGFSASARRSRILTNIEFGRVWDNIKIINGGVSSTESKVKETEIVWFEAVYEYDSEVFDGSKGILYMNDEDMIWSSPNQRWEKEVSSEKPQEIAYKITNVQDDQYSLISINDEVGSLIIEWSSRGIPGFPNASIIIGLIARIIIIWRVRKF